MPTEHVKYSLPDFILGKTGAQQRLEIERHLGVCQECRAELEQVKQSLGLIRERELAQPAPAFFSGILPRLRERLDRPRHTRLWSSPIGERIALPLAAAAVIVLMIVLTPTATGPDVPAGSLRAVLEQVSATELVDVFADEGTTVSVNSRMNQELMEVVVGEHIEKGGFVKDLVLNESGNGELPASLYQGILSNMSDEDVDNLLKRLEERTTL